MLFGKFLEHYPYFGLRGKEDENSWNKASDLSEKVYEHHFKTKLYGMSDLHPLVSLEVVGQDVMTMTMMIGLKNKKYGICV
ncbi:hypothetical protein TH0820_13110 [Helicobacter pylori]